MSATDISVDWDPLQTPIVLPETKALLQYELPKAVASARDGWQLTSQSGAVVSGLLASVAAQLLGFFESKESLSPSGARGFVIGTCYAAIFFNVNATIGSFVLIDNLGELGFEAARLSMSGRLDQYETMGQYHGEVTNLLKDFGASRIWKMMLFHWLATFYLGILSLIVSVLTYVILAESKAISILMCVLVGCTLVPTSLFIFFGGLGKSSVKRTAKR